MAHKKINLKNWIKKYWLAFVFILAFFLRLPSLFEPFTYGDEGIYLTLGQAMRKGAVFYRDIHDNKPPLLYFLAAFAENFFNYRLLLFVWSLATIYFFSKLSRLLFGKNNLAVFLSTSIFTIASSVRLFEGNIANAENFLIGTSLIGFYLFLTAKKNSQYFLAGFLFSLSALFKIPGAFDFAAAFALGLLLFISQKEKNYKLYARRSTLFTLGFLLPIALTFLYYACQNAFWQYLTAAFFQNFPYLASWLPDKPQAVGLPLPLLSRVLATFLVFAFLFFLRKRLSVATKLTLLWFSFSLFAALLSSRPYPHYLLQIVPPFALAFGLLFAKNKEKVVPALTIVVFTFCFHTFHFWRYPTNTYYQNFYTYALGLKSKNDYFAYFGKDAQSLYQTAAYIKTHTNPEESIFIWTNQPSLYPLSERSPVGRYAAAYHIIDFNGYEDTLVALKASPPRYLIWFLSVKQPFPALEALVENEYFKVKTIGEIEIYRHL